MNLVIVQVDSKGKQMKIIKKGRAYIIVDNVKDEFNNVHFLKDKDALVKFNEKLETII
jgi:hypothetical protein